MKRDEWLFDHTGAKLAEAAKQKKSAHQARKAWWEEKKAEVMAKARESGIEVRDSVAASYSNSKGNYGPQIEVDSGMQRDLTECQQKILEHDRLVRDYEGWIQVLTANPEARLQLDHEDYLFFFGT